MANATLTLKIAGTVNGKTIAYTGTQEVDNIDTVIMRLGRCNNDASVWTHGTSTYTPIADQDCDIMLAANVGTRGDLTFGVITAGDDIQFFLETGAFIIMQKATAGGVINASTTATTSTCVASAYFECLRSYQHITAPSYHIFGCYNYAS